MSAGSASSGGGGDAAGALHLGRPWVPLRLGEQRAREGAYIWRSLLDHGAVLASGTDTPVEDINPIATFYAAVTRRMADGHRVLPDPAHDRERRCAR